MEVVPRIRENFMREATCRHGFTEGAKLLLGVLIYFGF